MRVKESAVKFNAKKKVYTYQDYLNLPQNDSQYQLIGGELVMTPAPKIIHQVVAKRIFLLLNNFAEKTQSGQVFFAPCDVYLNDLNVVQPDIFFIANENKKIITEDNIKGSPDVIIEILSPNSAYYDLIEKKELYENSGVKEYWIVDPKKERIEIYIKGDRNFILHQRGEKNDNITSKILKGFSFPLSSVFFKTDK